METAKLSPEEVTVRPVTLAEWPDVQALFDEPGPHRGCWCMYWRVRRADFQRQYGEPLRQAMEAILLAGRVPGLLVYHEGRPVGWCSVAPREEFTALGRSRTLKPVDSEPVWSIVCFFVTRPYRHRGLVDLLVTAAIAYARENGARIVEAYPLLPEKAAEQPYERYMGVQTTFARLGFREVARRSDRRPIMRYWIAD
jgi:GNAT superfamily N-acetyltransferase